MRRCFEILGVALAVETDSERLLELIDVMYAAFPDRGVVPDMTLRVVPRNDHPGYYDMWSVRDDDEEIILENKHFDRVVMNIAVQFNSRALYWADMHTVHAGAVAAGGEVVAFPASSGAGKSTLAAACAQLGLEYVSDEALCLNWETGEVVPYPKPLWLSRWSRQSLGLDSDSVFFESPRYEEALLAAEHLGWRSATEPGRLAHVVSITSGDDGLGLTPGSRRGTADALVRHAFRRGQSAKIFSLVADSARSTRFWDLQMGSPRQTAQAIAGLLDD